MAKEIIRKDDGDTVVLDYVPKEFPAIVTPSAVNFVTAQEGPETATDFKISELVADQVGISELQRKSIENKIEEMALDRLKIVEEKAYKEAYDLGLIEGTAKAFEERRVEFEDQIQKMSDLLEGFESIKERLMAENEATFMTMIHEIASKITMKTVELDKELIIEVMKKVVNEIQSEDQVTVKISPEDMMFVESYKEKTNRNFDFLERLKLEASDSIMSGGCQVETNSGSIDATVRQRINKAWSVIENRLPKIKDDGATQAANPDDPEADKDGNDEGEE